jgi:hypothetical protein
MYSKKTYFLNTIVLLSRQSMYCTSSFDLDLTCLRRPEGFDTFENTNESFFSSAMIPGITDRTNIHRWYYCPRYQENSNQRTVAYSGSISQWKFIALKVQYTTVNYNTSNTRTTSTRSLAQRLRPISSRSRTQLLLKLSLI